MGDGLHCDQCVGHRTLLTGHAPAFAAFRAESVAVQDHGEGASPRGSQIVSGISDSTGSTVGSISPSALRRSRTVIVMVHWIRGSRTSQSGLTRPGHRDPASSAARAWTTSTSLWTVNTDRAEIASAGMASVSRAARYRGAASARMGSSGSPWSRARVAAAGDASAIRGDGVRRGDERVLRAMTERAQRPEPHGPVSLEHVCLERHPGRRAVSRSTSIHPGLLMLSSAEVGRPVTGASKRRRAPPSVPKPDSSETAVTASASSGGTWAGHDAVRVEAHTRGGRLVGRFEQSVREELDLLRGRRSHWWVVAPAHHSGGGAGWRCRPCQRFHHCCRSL